MATNKLTVLKKFTILEATIIISNKTFTRPHQYSMIQHKYARKENSNKNNTNEFISRQTFLGIDCGMMKEKEISTIVCIRVFKVVRGTQLLLPPALKVAKSDFEQ